MLTFTKKSGETRFGHRLNCLFWWIVRLLPVIIWVVAVWGCARIGEFDYMLNDIEFSKILGTSFGIFNDSDVIVALNSVFSDYLGFFDNSEPLMMYGVYLIFVEIFHLMIDILLFIPKLAHKWMNVWTQND